MGIYNFSNGGQINIDKQISIDAKGMSNEDLLRLVDAVVNDGKKAVDETDVEQTATETAEMTETRTVKVTRPVGTRSKMELLVRKHPDPAAFIAQLKLDVAACDSPKEKMRVVNNAIENGFLPSDLPHSTFCDEIEYIAQSTYSTWLNKSEKK